MEYKFKFTVVMSVYNVEPYLEEAVDSIINQSIGLQNIQIVFVDDGSKDNSGAICDRYCEQYPQNFKVIHKKNEGLARARQDGVKWAEGKYVSFTDPDDSLSCDTLSYVWDFFEKHEDQVDVVSIPQFFFGAASGEHPLAYKMEKGTRVIDLEEDYTAVQMSLCSSFIRREALDAMGADSQIVGAEDAIELLKILIKKKKLGVVAEARYNYRKREDSILASTDRKKGWYLTYIEHFNEWGIEYCLQELGYVPKFVLYMMAYDLNWRIKQKRIPDNLLDKSEKELYKKKIEKLIRAIDDRFWLEQKFMPEEHKAYVLKKKYNEPLQIVAENDEISVCVHGNPVSSLGNRKIVIHDLRIVEKRIYIEGEMYLFPEMIKDVDMSVSDGGKLHPCEHFVFRQPTLAMEEVVMEYKSFKVDIPIDKDSVDIGFVYTWKGNHARCTNVQFGHFVPVSRHFASSYCWKNGWKITPTDDGFHICRSDKKDALRSEIRFCKELWKANSLGSRKAVVLRTLSGMAKKLVRKPVWLISDRINKADDNGEAFFRYMREHHRKEVNCYYVLSKQSADFQRLRKIGPVVDDKGFMHKILFFCSQFNISAQADDITQNPFMGYEACYQDKLCDEQFIFLQHGVIQDDLSGWLNRYNKNIRGFVTSAPREKESIVRGNYLYTDKEVWLTGMPRHDRLYHDEKRRITIMPTWRRYLMSQINQTTGVWNVGNKFEQSEYYQFYNALLNDERLLKAAQEYKYQICFFPHPNVQALIDRFDRNDQVQFLRIDAKYREVYAESDLVVTDYSSAVFDFAYLRKPIVYCQFDADEFFGGNHVCQLGYFDYERDGFGEVERDLEGTVNRIIEYMRSDCLLKDKYRKRIDGFFAYHDQNNCERVYNKLIEASKE